MAYTDEQIGALVEPTRLHRSIYNDPEIFELEMERIWGSAWIFIGHESQVPNPGDYFTLNINHKIPVVMVRDPPTRCVVAAVRRTCRTCRRGPRSVSAPHRIEWLERRRPTRGYWLVSLTERVIPASNRRCRGIRA